MSFCNALSGSVTFWRRRRIDLSAGWKFALATIPGAVFGSHLAGYFTDRSFSIVFGTLLVLLAVLMYYNSRSQKSIEKNPNQNPNPHNNNSNLDRLSNNNIKKINSIGWVERKFQDAEGKEYCYAFNEYLGIGVSSGVGFISSILGIGGGIIHMPFMVMILKFPPHVAAATSLFILSWSALVGSITHFILGHFQWPMAVALSAGGVLGAQIGARVSSKINPRNLIRIFAVALVVVGLRLVVG